MKFKTIFLSSFFSVLCSCSVVPHSVDGTAHINDYQGGINGFIGYRTDSGIRYGILTDAGRNHYNTLISLYSVAFKNSYAIELKKDSGVRPYNGLWLIDKEHLIYFTWLCQMRRDNVPIDTFLQKVF